MYKQSGSKNKLFKEEIQITIKQQIKYSVKKKVTEYVRKNYKTKMTLKNQDRENNKY